MFAIILDAREFLLSFRNIKSSISSLFLISAMKPLPVKDIVARSTFLEFRISLMMLIKLFEKHSIFPISSMMMRLTESFRKGRESRNNSKPLRLTLYLPTLYGLFIFMCESIPLFPERLMSSNPFLVPCSLISAVKKPAGWNSLSSSVKFLINVVLPTPGAPVMKIFFFNL